MMTTHGSHKQVIVAILGASSGNLVEYYDFFVYSFGAHYFAASFFPAGNSTNQLLNTAGIFAAGFFGRPLGSWLFGRLADKRGRRLSLLASVALMGLGCLTVAVVPTYSSIGPAAPALLLVTRVAQGISMGGEYGAVATYLSEAGLKGHRGFFASFQLVGVVAGQFLALLTLLALELAFSESDMRAWGWRVPFVLGGAAAGASMFLRGSIAETGSVEAMSRKRAGSIFEVLKHPRAVLVSIGFAAPGTLFFYTFTSYAQKYLINTAHMEAKLANKVNLAALAVFMILQPAFGALSDRFGRKNFMLSFAILSIGTSALLFRFLGKAASPYGALGLLVTALAISSLYTSVAGLVKAELFPAEVRALGVGTTAAVAVAIFGGTGEYVALSFKSMGHEAWFGWYLTAVMMMSLVAGIAAPDTRTRGYLSSREGL